MDLLSQMATFVRVVETGSLSAAARREKLSLPAVSRQLRALEEDLGVSLVARSTRRLSVTDAGRRWYEHCVRVLREVEDARSDVAAGGALRGRLVVSASVTIGASLIVPRLAALVRTHPGLAVDMRLEDHLVDLVGDAVDVAVRGGVAPPDSASVVAHPLLQFIRVVVAAPAYLKKRGTPREPEQLAAHECLAQHGSANASGSWRLIDGAEARIITVRGGLRSNAPLALRDLARDGAGVALLPEWLVADDLAAGRLRRVLAAWSSVPITIWAIHRTELRGTPRVRAFLDAMEPGLTAPR